MIGLPGVGGRDVGRGVEHVAQGLALVGLRAGEREQDWQPAEGADQVQAQAPEVPRVRRAVAVLGPPARSERLAVSREQPQPTGVESTTQTSSLHSEVSCASILIMCVTREHAARRRLLYPDCWGR